VGETAADVIVKLRLMFDLYVNLRPIKAYPNIPAARPDIDLVIVRENTEDLYKGIEFMINKDIAVALRIISRDGSRRIAEFAFNLAERRRRRVTAVHKANVLKLTDGLFSQTCREVARQHPNITFDELYVDAASMHLIKRPHEFDVMVMPNLFGDILSDEAAQIIGGLGVAPGANIGDNYAMFEPIHGSARMRSHMRSSVTRSCALNSSAECGGFDTGGTVASRSVIQAAVTGSGVLLMLAGASAPADGVP
jgi:3-isopropylmalate dehydrogenase